MNTDNKTLAGVQPGGRVRLGDGLQLANEWRHVFDGDGHDMAGANKNTLRRFIQAIDALSAQPSPGGQGDASHYWPEVDRILVDAYVAGSEGDEFDMIAARTAIHAALAARQPVESEENVAADTYWTLAEMIEPHVQREGINPDGALPASVHDSVAILLEHWLRTRQPVGNYEVQTENGPLKCSLAVYAEWQKNEEYIERLKAELESARQPVGEPVGEVFWDNETGEISVNWLNGDLPPGIGTLLYDAPPAQAVDLGQFRDSVVQAISNVSYMTGYGPAYEKLTELLALIDNRGPRHG